MSRVLEVLAQTQKARQQQLNLSLRGYIQTFRTAVSERTRNQAADSARNTIGKIVAEQGPSLETTELLAQLNQPPSANSQVTSDGRRAPLLLKERPNIRLSDVAGNEEAKAFFGMMIFYSLAKFRPGIKVPRSRSVCLMGEPGVGKTRLAKALAGELGWPFIAPMPGDVSDKYHGESTKNVSAIFAQARAEAPAILFFDELESYAPRLTNAGDSPATNEALQTLKIELEDSVDQDLIVITTTNNIGDIDPAIVSRLELFMVPRPNEEARCEIFRMEAAERGVPSDVPWAELGRQSDRRTGRDIRTATLRAFDSMVRSSNSQYFGDDGIPIRELMLSNPPAEDRPFTSDDYDNALASMPYTMEEDTTESRSTWEGTR
jgi:SpoVK/Ycf46/Vps4 family AAA+-type ATPase